MKKLPMVCCMLLALLLLFPVCLAQDKQLVHDDAGLFTPEEVSVLQSAAAGIGASHKVDLVIVTTDNALGKTAQAYADDFYDNNGYGIGPQGSGALFLIDMDHREVYISTTGRMRSVLTDAQVQVLIDDIYSHLSEGAYFSAAEGFLEGVKVRLAQAPAESAMEAQGGKQSPLQETQPDRPAPAMQADSSVWMVSGLIGLLLGLTSCIIVVVRYRGSQKSGAHNAKKNAAFSLSRQEDLFLRENVVRTPLPKNDTHSGGSGGGRSHGGGGRSFSGGGRSHGGGGRKF